MPKNNFDALGRGQFYTPVWQTSAYYGMAIIDLPSVCWHLLQTDFVI